MESPNASTLKESLSPTVSVVSSLDIDMFGADMEMVLAASSSTVEPLLSSASRRADPSRHAYTVWDVVYDDLLAGMLMVSDRSEHDELKPASLSLVVSRTV